MLSEVAAKAVRDMCQECSNSMTRIEGERDYIKEAIDSVAEEHEFDKTLLRKLVSAYHKQNIKEFKDDADFLQETYDEVFNGIVRTK